MHRQARGQVITSRPRSSVDDFLRGTIIGFVGFLGVSAIYDGWWLNGLALFGLALYSGRPLVRR